MEDGNDWYYVAYDMRTLPMAEQNRDGIKADISRALNAMFELPQPEECSDPAQRKLLRWERHGAGWRRRVWRGGADGEGDEAHRQAQDTLFRWFSQYCDFFGRKPALNTFVLFVGLLLVGLVVGGVAEVGGLGSAVADLPALASAMLGIASRVGSGALAVSKDTLVFGVKGSGQLIRIVAGKVRTAFSLFWTALMGNGGADSDDGKTLWETFTRRLPEIKTWESSESWKILTDPEVYKDFKEKMLAWFRSQPTPPTEADAVAHAASELPEGSVLRGLFEFSLLKDWGPTAWTGLLRSLFNMFGFFRSAGGAGGATLGAQANEALRRAAEDGGPVTQEFFEAMGQCPSSEAMKSASEAFRDGGWEAASAAMGRVAREAAKAFGPSSSTASAAVGVAALTATVVSASEGGGTRRRAKRRRSQGGVEQAGRQMARLASEVAMAH